jgi:hydroxymethylglutaryl-CoA lyase
MQSTRTIYLTDVGPRDGLQSETALVPTDLKLEVIAGLAAAGLPAVQVASFVHPVKVPQMADAEAVIAGLPTHFKTDFSALTLNLKGMQRACATPIPWVEVSLAATEAQSRRNAGMSIAQAQRQMAEMIALAKRSNRKVRATIQCTFGCVQFGEVSEAQLRGLAEPLLAGGVDLLLLADTTGLATPPAVRRMLDAVLPLAGQAAIGLHLHDTRGLGLVNVAAGLEMGVRHFDASLGGLGGCPFVPDAAGNIATEETLYLLHAFGFSTGVDIAAVAALSRRLSAFFDRPLTGKLYRLL